MNDMVAFSAIFHHETNMSKYTDKLEVRNFIISTIGKQYLSTITQIAPDIDEINLTAALGHFIKTNNSSGGFFKYDDHRNKENLRRQITKHLRINNYGESKGEFMYRGIKPKVYVEKELKPFDMTMELLNYRFFYSYGNLLAICIRGEAFFHYYSKELKPLFARSLGEEFKTRVCKPPELDMDVIERVIKPMKKLGANCTKTFHFCRFDGYDTAQGLKFGELTFMHLSGCAPEEESEIVGRAMMKVSPNFFER